MMPSSQEIHTISKNLLMVLKALRHVFKSDEDAPPALDAELSNWRPWAWGLIWNPPREQTS